MEITIHTGCQGEYNQINISWFDHNNVSQLTVINVNVLDQDKPRTLEILVNNLKLLEVVPK
jgi:hypothetical protein